MSLTAIYCLQTTWFTVIVNPSGCQSPTFLTWCLNWKKQSNCFKTQQSTKYLYSMCNFNHVCKHEHGVFRQFECIQTPTVSKLLAFYEKFIIKIITFFIKSQQFWYSRCLDTLKLPENTVFIFANILLTPQVNHHNCFRPISTEQNPSHLWLKVLGYSLGFHPTAAAEKSASKRPRVL